MDTKYCTRCCQAKPITEFGKNKSAKDGLASTCKYCRHNDYLHWKNENPEKAKALWRKAAAGTSRYTRKARQLLKLYGITMVEYEAILSKQEGRCATCKSLPTEMMLSVDHDHVTGVVRGLLCKNCNLSLGYIKDSIETAKNLVSYLESSIITNMNSLDVKMTTGARATRIAGGTIERTHERTFTTKR